MSVDPYDDFYEFACGGYIASHHQSKIELIFPEQFLKKSRVKILISFDLKSFPKIGWNS